MVPRFKLSFHSSVVGALDKLGLRLPFHEAADLSDMMDSGFPMFVSDVIHKAVIEVSEEGTKAAAVTMDMIKSPKKGRMQAPPVDFVADHPFAYFIVEEETEAVVFAGHVLDPSRK
jgi:serpin B